MTVTTLVQHVESDRIIDGVPQGVRQWSAGGTVTGSSGGGNMKISLNFNVNADRSFASYVAVRDVMVRATVADPLNGYLWLPAADWERPSRSGLVGVVTPPMIVITTVLASNAAFVGASHEWVMLGRAVTGTDATLNVEFDEVDTSVLTVYLNGLISDHPFTVPSDVVV